MRCWAIWLLGWSMALSLLAERPMLRVAAAADLQQAFPDLQQAFLKRHPGLQVVPSFGSSGHFAAQVQSRAPFDVFMSADLQYPQLLAAAGWVRGAVRPYARGFLVLWARHDSPLKPHLGWEGLRSNAIRRLTLANPKHAPYGRAAETALRKAGLWDSLQGRLAFGENVSQAAQFAQSGAADGALVALALAKGPSLSRVGTFWEVPASSHPPILQAAVVLTWTQQPEAAEAWVQFLLGAEGQAILARHGFGRPE